MSGEVWKKWPSLVLLCGLTTKNLNQWEVCYFSESKIECSILRSQDWQTSTYLPSSSEHCGTFFSQSQSSTETNIFERASV